jgi:hypothetical protein
MRFIEMTGKTLVRMVDVHALDPAALRAAGVGDDTIVRVNEQGDIEVRRRDRWDVIGGLLTDFHDRLRRETGLDWAEAEPTST